MGCEGVFTQSYFGWVFHFILQFYGGGALSDGSDGSDESDGSDHF